MSIKSKLCTTIHYIEVTGRFVIWLVHDKLQRLCHRCNKDVLCSAEACDFNCGVLFSGVFIHHSVLDLNHVCLWHLESLLRRLRAWFQSMSCHVLWGLFCLSVFQQPYTWLMLSGGVAEGRRGQGSFGKGPGIFTNAVKVLTDEKRDSWGGVKTAGVRQTPVWALEK